MIQSRQAATVLAVAAGAFLCSPPLAAAEAPSPLFWAYGLTSSDDLDLYHSLGFNVLYIDVPADTGGTDPRVRDLVTAAKRRDLSVILGLPTALHRDPTDRHDPISPLNQSYLDDVERFVYSVVAAYQSEPAVIGWGLQHGPANTITYCDRDFRAYLRRSYTSVEALNAAWGTRLLGFDSARLGDAKRNRDQPFGIGRAALDVAEYKRAAFEDLHTAWTKAIRKFDDTRLIFSGRQTRPRNLISLPGDINYIVPDSQAFGLDVDLQTCGADAIDIARRAGRFEVIPVLRVPPSMGLEPRARARHAKLLTAWMRLAEVHGARGLAFASWRRLRRAIQAEPNLAARLGGGTPLADAVRRELKRGGFGLEPRASAAIIYEPYAKGMSVQGRELYGFLEDQGEGEPNRLLNAFRAGTIFGGMDVLSLEDVERADLSRYGVILAPQMYRTPPEALAALDEYVMGGGALVADYGFGVYEARSWLALPERAAAMFGIRKFVGVSNTYSGWRAQNAKITGNVPGFPSLVHGQTTAGDAARYAAPNRGATSAGTGAFAGFHSTAVLGNETRIVGVIGTDYDASVGRGVSGIFAAGRGLGMAVYATVRLWANWRPTDPVYQAFHADLLARRPAIVLRGADGLFPKDLSVGAIEDGVWALNRRSFAALVQILAPGAEGRAYAGAAAEASSGDVTPEGRRTGAVLVSLSVPPGELVVARSAPLRVEPVTGTCVALLTTYSRDKVELEIGGRNARATKSRAGRLAIVPGLPTDVRVTLEDGLYRVQPGSRHTVAIRHPTGRTAPKTLQLQADPEGRLRFTESLSHHIVTITPLSAPGRAPEEK